MNNGVPFDVQLREIKDTLRNLVSRVTNRIAFDVCYPMPASRHSQTVFSGPSCCKPPVCKTSISTFSKLPGCKIRIPTVPSTLAGSVSPPKSLSPRPITSNLLYPLESVPDVLLADGALERDAGIKRVQ